MKILDNREKRCRTKEMFDWYFDDLPDNKKDCKQVKVKEKINNTTRREKERE